jgi:periplasmic mercuric ion binding protein
MNIKTLLPILTAIFCTVVVSSWAADTTVTLKGVHLCCTSCAKGVDAAVAKVAGVSATSDRDAKTVTIKAPDQAAAQNAVNALVAAGYFGASSNPSINVAANTGAKDEKVQSLEVTGVHLCCNNCVKSVTEALTSVTGVKGNTATRDAKSFTVTGDFNAKDVFAALQKAGLTGSAGK